MKGTALIQYPAFRTWQTMQKRSNNSIVALAIGAGLAEQEMARSTHRAGAVLAGVAHAERLDVTSTDAQRIFRTATEDMAFLAIPQVVALHIELCVGTVIECQRFQGVIAPHNKAPEWWAVPDLAKTVRFGEAETTADHLMKFCVKLRNTIMHGAGKVDDQLVKVWSQLPQPAKTRWEELTGRPFTYEKVGALPDLRWPEVMATLAVTKESAGEINARVGWRLTREQWAQVIAFDYRDGSLHGRRRFNSMTPGRTMVDENNRPHPGQERALQRLLGHATTYYRPLGMTLDELRAGRAAIR
ncbi:hypothetical protein ABT052_28890 [Streptomyces sp. NPDC002766]|uniref:hypothetical protein n=1 Tax=Streptomyces sp. NPDC002766 TaxID=3154429 RepID=UPI003324312A